MGRVMEPVIRSMNKGQVPRRFKNKSKKALDLHQVLKLLTQVQNGDDPPFPNQNILAHAHGVLAWRNDASHSGIESIKTAQVALLHMQLLLECFDAHDTALAIGDLLTELSESEGIGRTSEKNTVDLGSNSRPDPVMEPKRVIDLDAAASNQTKPIQPIASESQRQSEPVRWAEPTPVQPRVAEVERQLEPQRLPQRTAPTYDRPPTEIRSSSSHPLTRVKQRDFFESYGMFFQLAGVVLIIGLVLGIWVWIDIRRINHNADELADIHDVMYDKVKVELEMPEAFVMNSLPDIDTPNSKMIRFALPNESNTVLSISLSPDRVSGTPTDPRSRVSVATQEACCKDDSLYSRKDGSGTLQEYVDTSGSPKKHVLSSQRSFRKGEYTTVTFSCGESDYAKYSGMASRILASVKYYDPPDVNKIIQESAKSWKNQKKDSK